MERIARSLGISLVDQQLSVNEAAQLIIDRSEQLTDSRSRDKQTLIQTLQQKLRSVKERLELKVV